MRKVFSVLLKILAGFFFYAVCLLGFVNEPQTGIKLGIMVGLLVPALAALAAGLALTRFDNWRRDTGIVLLCASGFTLFLIFSMACYLMAEEVRAMMSPDTLAVFSDYLTGGGAMVGFAVLGGFFMKTNKMASQ
jgi:hypothetical protein